MSLRVDGNRMIESSVLGAMRGVLVHTMIHPLEVIRFRYQCSLSREKYGEVIRSLWSQGGITGFYRGLSSQYMKITLKQIWCWPMITGVPQILPAWVKGDLLRQGITGVAIATMDAVVTNPLEKRKIHAAVKGNTPLSWRELYVNGWKGVGAHFAKSSTAWVTFLVAQKVFQNRESRGSSSPLSVGQLCKVGAEAGLVVSVICTPFDWANTLKQLQGSQVSYSWLRLCQGWPLYATSLIIQNIASAALLYHFR